MVKHTNDRLVKWYETEQPIHDQRDERITIISKNIDEFNTCHRHLLNLFIHFESRGIHEVPIKTRYDIDNQMSNISKFCYRLSYWRSGLSLDYHNNTGDKEAMYEQSNMVDLWIQIVRLINYALKHNRVWNSVLFNIATRMVSDTEKGIY